MILSDEDLDRIYFDAVGEHLNDDRRVKCKAFIEGLFRVITVEAYINGDGEVGADAFMLSGTPTPLYPKPELEK